MDGLDFSFSEFWPPSSPVPYPGYAQSLHLVSGALGKNHRKTWILIYTADTKYTFYIWSFSQLLCLRDSSSFQYQLKIPDAYLFVWKFPVTAAFNSDLRSMCVNFPLFCIVCIVSAVLWQILLLIHQSLCLPPTPVSVLPFDLGKTIPCSGLLCQAFDSSYLLAVPLSPESMPPLWEHGLDSRDTELLGLHQPLCLVHLPKRRLFHLPRFWLRVAGFCFLEAWAYKVLFYYYVFFQFYFVLVSGVQLSG